MAAWDNKHALKVAVAICGMAAIKLLCLARSSPELTASEPIQKTSGYSQYFHYKSITNTPARFPPVGLVAAIIEVESGGNPRSVGKAGERGLMQIKEQTWYDTCRRLYGRPISFDHAFDPVLNVIVGTSYLVYLEELVKRNFSCDQRTAMFLATAAYNCGPSFLLEKTRGIPYPPERAVAYANKVLSIYATRYQKENYEISETLRASLDSLTAGRTSKL